MTVASLGPLGLEMREKLKAAFAPERIELIDESHRHVGHAGHRPEGETHFRLEMSSAAFSGLNRVARQRAVMKILEAELADRVHALSLVLKAPGED
ncbi:MAG: BolA family transcriptional regulator [Rhodothalassiaceae bacterium]